MTNLEKQKRGRGRPGIYATAAERAKAWRQRQKDLISQAQAAGEQGVVEKIVHVSRCPEVIQVVGKCLVEIELSQLVASPVSLPASEQQILEIEFSIAGVGLVNPLVVRPFSDDQFEIIDGHARAVALKKLGKTAAPAILMTMSDKEAYAATATSGFVCKGGHPDFAAWRQLEKLEATKVFVTNSELAMVLGRERRQINTLRSFAKLPPAVLQILEVNPTLLDVRTVSALIDTGVGAELVIQGVQKLAAGSIKCQGDLLRWLIRTNEKTKSIDK